MIVDDNLPTIFFYQWLSLHTDCRNGGKVSLTTAYFATGDGKGENTIIAAESVCDN